MPDQTPETLTDEDLRDMVERAGREWHMAQAPETVQELARELLAARADLASLRRGGETLGKIVDRQCRDVLAATGLHHLIDADGDGDWGLVWERLAGMGARITELEAAQPPRFSQRQFMQAIRDRDEAQARAAELAETCADFINERVEYVQALKGCADETADYHRWTGGAEARRQLAERLGWTTPYEFGDKTGPIVADGDGTRWAAAQPAPAGYAIGLKDAEGEPWMFEERFDTAEGARRLIEDRGVAVDARVYALLEVRDDA